MTFAVTYMKTKVYDDDIQKANALLVLKLYKAYIKYNINLEYILNTMEKYLVLTENDESQWDDQTGIKYHYPSKYKSKIQTGTKIIYYKGRLKKQVFSSMRLSNDPHYFGTGVIGKVEQQNGTNNYFASIANFKLFNEAVSFKNQQGYLELKANSFKGNFFRGNAVREITNEEYENIISKADIIDQTLNDPLADYNETHSNKIIEGKKISFYSTKYERSKYNRDMALKIHGYSCCICSINFKEKYGEIGEGFIHIHHIKPLYSLEEEVIIDPANDLVPVCPNCHAIIHRNKGKILSIKEMKEMYHK